MSRQGATIFGHDTGEVEDGDEAGVETGFDPLGTEFGDEDETGHEGDLTEHTEKDIVAHGEEPIGKTDLGIHVSDENDGRGTEDGGGTDDPEEELSIGSVTKTLAIQIRTKHHGGVTNTRHDAEKGRTEMEFIDEKVEERSVRTGCRGKHKDKDGGFPEVGIAKGASNLMDLLTTGNQL